MYYVFFYIVCMFNMILRILMCDFGWVRCGMLRLNPEQPGEENQ